MSNKKYDFVLFGASGYAGEFCVEEIARVEKMGHKLNWAAAGRNTTKLKNIVKSAYAVHDMDCSHVGIVVVTTEDADSLRQMCQEAKLLVNCVGPFPEHGFNVIEACLEKNCHYIDISTESEFQEIVSIRYDHIAKEKGIYIILSCAFYSLLPDMNLLYLKKNFGGDVNSIETFCEFGPGEDGSSSFLTPSTWRSGILDRGDSLKLQHLQEATNSTEYPRSRFALENRFPIHYSEVSKSWCLHDNPCNFNLVKKTQRYLYQNNNERPCQVMGYLSLPFFILAVIFWFFMKWLAIVSSLPYGKEFLTKYYRLTSLGTCEEGKPVKSGVIIVRCHATGWKTSLNDPNTQYSDPPNKSKTLILKFPGSTHYFTGTLVATAIHLFWSQHDKLPKVTGVLSPGAAFHNTDYIPFLEKMGATVEFLDQ